MTKRPEDCRNTADTQGERDSHLRRLGCKPKLGFCDREKPARASALWAVRATQNRIRLTRALDLLFSNGKVYSDEARAVLLRKPRLFRFTRDPLHFGQADLNCPRFNLALSACVADCKNS